MSTGSGQSLQPSFAPAKATAVPSWKAAYEKTVWESDAEKLPALIHATEDALFLRWLELSNAPAHQEERAAMNAAAADLLAIKIHKLGWPSPARAAEKTARAVGC
jgi:hypothetical protein